MPPVFLLFSESFSDHLRRVCVKLCTDFQPWTFHRCRETEIAVSIRTTPGITIEVKAAKTQKHENHAVFIEGCIECCRSIQVISTSCLSGFFVWNMSYNVQVY